MYEAMIGRGRVRRGRALALALVLGLPVLVLNGAVPGVAAASSAPANDNFPGAALSGWGVSVAGNNAGATVEAYEPEGVNPDSLQHTVWYTWTVPAWESAQDARVTVNTADFDTEVAIFVGPEMRRLTHVVSNDDANGTTNESTVTFSAYPRSIVRIQVDGWGGAQGSFALSIGRVGNLTQNCSWGGCDVPYAVPNDFPGFGVAGGVTGGFQGDSTTAQGEPGEPDVFPSDASLWYSWTAPESGTLRLTTVGRSAVDPTLAVFTGDAVSTLTPLGANDNYNSVDSLLDVPVQAGQTYRVQLDGAGVNTRGVLGMQFAVNPPANDLFAAAQPIRGRSGVVTGTGDRALPEPGDPTGGSVWYTYTAPRNGLVAIQAVNGYLTAYQGDSLATLTPVGTGDAQRVNINTTAGAVYRLRVSGGASSIELRWSYTTCDGRIATLVSSGTITGTPGDDVIIASGGDDTINSGDGHDVICARAGNDVVQAGAGNDRVFGGHGDDVLHDGVGWDEIYGDAGRDLIVASPTSDGRDLYDGRAGVDTVSYRYRIGSVSVVLDDQANDGAAGEGDNVVAAESLVGGSGDDTLTGGPLAGTMSGLGGNDTLNGGDGTDILSGGPGNDTIDGQGGNDTVNGGTEGDILTGGSGNDTVAGGSGDDAIDIQDGVAGNDSANGGPDLDTVTSDPGDTVTNV